MAVGRTKYTRRGRGVGGRKKGKKERRKESKQIDREKKS